MIATALRLKLHPTVLLDLDDKVLSTVVAILEEWSQDNGG